jgi:hypothetical protein
VLGNDYATAVATRLLEFQFSSLAHSFLLVQLTHRAAACGAPALRFETVAVVSLVLKTDPSQITIRSVLPGSTVVLMDANVPSLIQTLIEVEWLAPRTLGDLSHCCE